MVVVREDNAHIAPSRVFRSLLRTIQGRIAISSTFFIYRNNGLLGNQNWTNWPAWNTINYCFHFDFQSLRASNQFGGVQENV